MSKKSEEKGWSDVFAEEDKRIKFMESVLNAIYRENIVTDDKGNVKPKLSPGKFLECVEAEDKIMQMKRRRYNFPKELR